MVKGLATDPARRPETAGEFVELLRAGWGSNLPTGVLTFVLTDIEGSTPLWEAHPEVMAGEADDLDRLVSGLLDTQDLLADLVVWLLDTWRADLPVPELRLTAGGVSLFVRCPDPEVRAEVEELVDAAAGRISLALYVEAS